MHSTVKSLQKVGATFLIGQTLGTLLSLNITITQGSCPAVPNRALSSALQHDVLQSNTWSGQAYYRCNFPWHLCCRSSSFSSVTHSHCAALFFCHCTEMSSGVPQTVYHHPKAPAGNWTRFCHLVKKPLLCFFAFKPLTIFIPFTSAGNYISQTKTISFVLMAK